MSWMRKAAGVLVATCAIALSACAFSGPKSASEVYDKFVEGAYDNYSIDGTVSMSGEAPSDVEAILSSMSYDVAFEADVAKPVTHADIDVKLNFGAFSVDMEGESYVDDENGVSYTKMTVPGFGSGDTWTKSEIGDIVDADAVAKMRPAFEKAGFETADDTYIVTMTVGDLMDTGALDEAQSEDVVTDMGSDLDAMREAPVTYVFDDKCRLTEVRLDEFGFDDESGSHVVVSAIAHISKYGAVDAIAIPEEAKAASESDDASSLLDVLSGGDAATEETAAGEGGAMLGDGVYDELDTPLEIGSDENVKVMLLGKGQDAFGTRFLRCRVENVGDADVTLGCAYGSFSVGGQMTDPSLYQSVKAGAWAECDIEFYNFDGELADVSGNIEVYDADYNVLSTLPVEVE